MTTSQSDNAALCSIDRPSAHACRAIHDQIGSIERNLIPPLPPHLPRDSLRRMTCAFDPLAAQFTDRRELHQFQNEKAPQVEFFLVRIEVSYLRKPMRICASQITSGVGSLEIKIVLGSRSPSGLTRRCSQPLAASLAGVARTCHRQLITSSLTSPVQGG